MRRLLLALFLLLLEVPVGPKPLTASETSRIKFTSTDGTQVRAQLAKPDGAGPFPAVVLLHSCSGVDSHVSHDWPNFLTDNGYATLTPNVYRARGFENCGEDSRKGRRLDYFHNDAYGALDYLAGLPFIDRNRVAVMGFSRGASAINNSIVTRYALVKRDLNFAAAITLYGFCNTMGSRFDGAIPVMIILGGKDKRSLLSCGSKKIFAPAVDVQILPDAYHAFDKQEARGKYDCCGNFASYSLRATKKAHALSLQFLNQRMP